MLQKSQLTVWVMLKLHFKLLRSVISRFSFQGNWVKWNDKKLVCTLFHTEMELWCRLGQELCLGTQKHGLPTGLQPSSGTSTCSGVGSSMGWTWISAPPWTFMCCRGTACLTMVFTMGCRRIYALASGAPPPSLSSLTLVSVELFLSHLLSPLSCCNCCCAATFSAS